MFNSLQPRLHMTHQQGSSLHPKYDITYVMNESLNVPLRSMRMCLFLVYKLFTLVPPISPHLLIWKERLPESLRYLLLTLYTLPVSVQRVAAECKHKTI